MSVKPVPEGYHTLTPYLVVKGAQAALDFYTRAFGAAELYRLGDSSGRVGHAEMKLGDSHFMLADEFPDVGAVAPREDQGHSVSFLVYVENVDAAFERAVAAGARVVRRVQDQFYGDRSGTVVDPFGHQWTIATHVADVPPEEMQRRFKEMTAPGGGA